MGGAGADYVAYALALEEIAAGDGATSTIMSGHNSVGCMPILEYGSAAQKERYLKPLARGEKLCAFCLTEPQGGSDASALTTRAERRGEGYALRGTKQFITTGRNADVALVFASEMAERVCSDSIQTFGGYGYLEDYGVERIYRAVRVSKIYEGTNDIQHLVIARAIAG